MDGGVHLFIFSKKVIYNCKFKLFTIVSPKNEQMQTDYYDMRELNSLSKECNFRKVTLHVDP